MLKSKLIGTGTALVLAGGMAFGPGAMSANAAPAPAAVSAAKPVVGTVQQTLSGTFTPDGGVAQALPAGVALSNLTTSVVNGVMQLSGTITGLPGGAQNFTTPLPLDAIQPGADLAGQGCEILDLVLGPLHLDLLGLVVDLNQVELNITAVPGAGNLLGNLLCAVAGLLDGPGGALGGISALLNRLLAGLGLGL